jgi:chromate reductase, NAD(P)H dehydrogenase (quinone)
MEILCAILSAKQGEDMDMNQSLKVIGICGSLRQHSYNKLLLQAAGKLLADQVQFSIADISGIPLFNQDHEDPLPEVVANLKSAIESADALVISTPEYNFSIPGVLKNAIDWLTRPAGQNSLNGKPVATIGATIGGFGTVGAQLHLRQVLSVLNMYVVNQPMVLVAQAHTKFDDEGNLTDQMAQDLLKQLMTNLVNWTQQLKK